jgi:hypothetical protein
MLARRREQIFLVLGLVALNVLLGWYLARLARDYRSRTRWIYAGVHSVPLSTPAAAPNQAAWPQSFTQIVDRSLFSPQRSSQPPQPAQEAKAPELPLLYGTMNLGDGWFALMAPGGQSSPASKRVLPGEEIGGYKLLSIATSQVVLDWEEKKFTVDVSESARRVPRIVEGTERSAAATSTAGRSEPAPVAGSRTAAVTSVGGSSAGAAHQASGYMPQGADADAPLGTIIDGRRKILAQTPFGPQVRWELVQPSGSQAPNQNQPQNKQP